MIFLAELPRLASDAALFADIDRRLRALETAPVADHMSVRNGRLVVLDGANNNSNAAVFGSDPTGSTAGIGIWIGTYDAGATPPAPRALMQVDSVNGWAKPGWPLIMLPSPFGGGFYAGNPTNTPVVFTNSGTMTELYRCDFDSVGANISYDIVVQNLATTMDWQLQIAENTGGTLQTIASVTGFAGGSAQVNGTVAIPTSCLAPASGTNPRGRFLTMRLSARVATGAGNVTAAPTTQWRNKG